MTTMVRQLPSFLVSLRRFRSNPKNFSPTTATVNKLVDAFDLAISSPSPRIENFCGIVTSIVKLNDYRTAVILLQRMEATGIRHNHYSLTIMMKCYSSLNRMGYSMSLLAKLFKLGFDADIVTMNTLIRGFCFKDIEKAVELRNHLVSLGYILNHYTTGALLDGLCASKQTQLAVRLLKNTDNPNVVMFNSVISFLSKDGKIQEAFSLYDEMLSRNISPDVVTFDSLVYGLCRLGKPHEAFPLLKEMMSRFQVIPDTRILNVLINGLCRQDCLDQALQVLGLLFQQSISPDIVSFNLILDAYCRNDHIDKAKRLFSYMENCSVLLNTRTVAIMVRGLCKSQRVDEALVYFDEFISKGLQPDSFAYSVIIDGLCKSRQKHHVSNALTLFGEMQDMGIAPDAVLYSSFLELLVNSGRMEEATTFHQKMQLSGIQPTMTTYTLLLTGFSKSGRINEALQVWNDIRSKGYPIDTIAFTAMVQGLCQNGFLDRAYVLFSEMQHLANHITFKTMIASLSRSSNIVDQDRAHVLRQRMFRRFSPK